MGVSTDDCCAGKGKSCVYSCERRMEMVGELKYVDLVIPEHDMKQKIEDIKKYHVDRFVLGSDYSQTFKEMEEYEEVNRLCEIIFLERTPDISTTQLKENYRENVVITEHQEITPQDIPERFL